MVPILFGKAANAGNIDAIPGSASVSEQRFEIEGQDVGVKTVAATGEIKSVLIWLPSETGHQPEQLMVAEALSQRHYEIWFPSLLDDLFLPVVSSSLSRIPASIVAELVQTARKKHRVSVFVIAEGDGVIPALRGAWYQTERSGEAVGVVLMSGKFLLETPDPGEPVKYYPIVGQAALPVYLLQPDLSPWFWTMNESVKVMEGAGSRVYRTTLSGLRDRFYYRQNATDHEKTMAHYLPFWIDHAAETLIATSFKPPAKPRATVANTSGKPRKREKKLRVYKRSGSLPLRLNDLQKVQRDLKQLQGRVVLVNYWASWCPPCRHEIPSLNRLVAHYRDKPFKIVGVNMAEDKNKVETFLKQTPIDFEIWMDHDGRALKTWKVIAFPTSFLVDKKGNIRYGMVGSVDWMRKDIRKTIDDLIKEHI